MIAIYRSRIMARGNSAGRCHSLVGFLGDIPFPPLLHFGAALYSLRFTLIGSQDLDVNSRPDLSTPSTPPEFVVGVIDMSMEQHRNERVGETGDPRENPPTNGLVRHDSHVRKSGVTPPGSFSRMTLDAEIRGRLRKNGITSTRRELTGKFLILSQGKDCQAALMLYYDGMVQVDPDTGDKVHQVSSFVSFFDTVKTLFWGLFCMSSLESTDVIIENLPDSDHGTTINKHSFTQAVGHLIFASKYNVGGQYWTSNYSTPSNRRRVWIFSTFAHLDADFTLHRNLSVTHTPGEREVKDILPTISRKRAALLLLHPPIPLKHTANITKNPPHSTLLSYSHFSKLAAVRYLTQVPTQAKHLLESKSKQFKQRSEALRFKNLLTLCYFHLFLLLVAPKIILVCQLRSLLKISWGKILYLTFTKVSAQPDYLGWYKFSNARRRSSHSIQVLTRTRKNKKGVHSHTEKQLRLHLLSDAASLLLGRVHTPQKPHSKAGDELLDPRPCTHTYTGPHPLLKPTPSQRPDLSTAYTYERLERTPSTKANWAPFPAASLPDRWLAGFLWDLQDGITMRSRYAQLGATAAVPSNTLPCWTGYGLSPHWHENILSFGPIDCCVECPPLLSPLGLGWMRRQMQLNYLAQSTLPPPLNLIPTRTGLRFVTEWYRYMVAPPQTKKDAWSLMYCCYKCSLYREEPISRGADVEGYFTQAVLTRWTAEWRLMSQRCEGSLIAVAERLACSLASHQGDTGSIPGRVTPDFRMWESCWTMPLVGGCSRGSPVSPAFLFRHCSILPSITHIVSQDLDVKSRPNLFTQSRQVHDHVQEKCADQNFPIVMSQLVQRYFREKEKNSEENDQDFELNNLRLELQECKRMVRSLTEKKDTKQGRNARMEETRYLRKNPPTSGFIRHDPHVLKSGSDPARNRARLNLVGGECSSR
ncbi:hypothetical protein PR048_021699 [Dryococelus australis]|uniref:Uncharacterized protein n=1 Tax=Dryococelus australis TaxID=614101 RepID=A0ABQ9GYY1_9NEOP|nr:hypothetical protein PR048_021699 [Dryococelus australis]